MCGAQQTAEGEQEAFSHFWPISALGCVHQNITGALRWAAPGLSSGMGRNKEDMTSALTVTSHGQNPSPHGWQITDFGTDDSKPISEKQAK